ncbi:hypothetical protein GGI35DRAFT_450710 [Trichoderma velutinum]
MPGRLATPTSNWLRMRRGDGTQKSPGCRGATPASLPRSIHTVLVLNTRASLALATDRPPLRRRRLRGTITSQLPPSQRQRIRLC